ncbi:MAG: glycoside hydrolase family 16 protein [Bacteroidetes bacterium]|nr:glycoside hydrolase family 16 protein [Bacteroidota bacterium]MBU1116816.1 glycoside hydrolase family 16 protein [Bacteroidota bacterium]MBU1799421.1 glycoside hydrolase family 16 protein [Bacteroidota bacterium]
MKSKNIALVLIFLSTFVFGCNNDNSVNVPKTEVKDSTSIEGYNLVWNDEFDVNGMLDEAKWSYETGGGGWGNDELQYYTSDPVNVRVKDGKLEIEAHYYKDAAIKYTSARLVTRQKGDWLYGKIDVKAKIPTGLGTWPAIWMLSTDWQYGSWPASGEIDIMEHVGYDQNRIHGSIHTEAYNHKIGTQKSNQIIIPTASTEFHVYSIDWDSTKIDFLVDNEKYFSFSNEHKTSAEWPFDKRFHLLLNLAFGGAWGGAQGIDNSCLPAKMEVEYVRVYEKK